MDGSVKARVIALATKDPFLTVEELAQSVETTNRYVRTILSEADLSLNSLRRNYVRLLERRLGQQSKTFDLSIEKDLKVKRISIEEVSPFIEGWTQREIIQASALLTTGDLISYEQLITPESLSLQTGYNSLRDLLPDNMSNNLAVGKQKAEILWAPSELSTVLGYSHSTQVFKLTTVLHNGGLPCAIEVSWFSLDGLVLHWSHEDPEVKVSLIS